MQSAELIKQKQVSLPPDQQFVTRAEMNTTIITTITAVLDQAFRASEERILTRMTKIVDERISECIKASEERMTIRVEKMIVASEERIIARVEKIVEEKVNELAVMVKDEFGRIEKRFDGIEKRLDSIESKLQ